MIPLKRKLGKRGDSYTISIPRDYVDGLKLKDKDILNIIVKEGKYGPYLAIWCERQQQEGKTLVEMSPHIEP